MILTFSVDGIPAPQGSKRYLGQRGGKGITVESSKRTAPWRADVRAAATEAVRVADGYAQTLWDRPIAVSVAFRFARPKSHYGSGGNVDVIKGSAPSFHCQTPDVDKLARAVLDAMTGIVYADDKTIHRLVANKWWTSDKPGADVSVQVIE